MEQYKALSGETLFDVAAKLYNGDASLGVSDLLSKNSQVNLNAADLGGTTLNYTAGLKRAKPVIIATPGVVTPPTYKTRSLQTVYDLCIQLYGDVSKIGNLLKVFPNLDEQITVGNSVSPERSSDPVKGYFTDRELIVSTDLEDHIFILLENGRPILQQNERKIQLE